MYHFINQWDHIKLLKSAAPLPIHKFGVMPDYSKLELPNSQHIISRLVSIGINCTWDDVDVERLGDKIKSAIEKITCD